MRPHKIMYKKYSSQIINSTLFFYESPTSTLIEPCLFMSNIVPCRVKRKSIKTKKGI